MLCFENFDCIFCILLLCSSDSCNGVKQSRLWKSGGTYCISADIFAQEEQEDKQPRVLSFSNARERTVKKRPFLGGPI